jgi:hypothetical protein
MSGKPKATSNATGSEPVPDVRDDIYNLEAAARRCRVSTDQIRDWIDQGLRAFPIGESIKYRARDYVILEEWLLDFFRGRGGLVRKTADGADKARDDPKKKTARGGTPNRDQPLGPCPV